ncbi:unnamed protein product [Auanema sp. JU1783]|nr:unnamed protein product [Auanema sp. JU1783]
MSLVTLLITLVCSASLALIWIIILTVRFCIIRKLRERNELLLIVAYLILSGVYPLGHLFMAWQRVEKYLNAKEHDQIYSLRYECLYNPAVILQNIGSWSISFTVAFTALCLIYVATYPIEFFDVFDWHIALLPFGGTIACTTIAVVTEIWFMNYKKCENTRLSGLCFRIDVLGEDFYRMTQLIRISIFSLSFVSVIIAYVKAKKRMQPNVSNDWRFLMHTKRMFGTILKLGRIKI